MTETTEYKIALDNFSGPMDLLLFLIRKEEIDIRDIPIARVLDQYMVYLEALKSIDLDAAGEFLVMASTLMLIKSKMLLPIEEVDLSEELDPRYELVRQLLEYKRIRDRVRFLEEQEEVQGQRVARPESARPEPLIEEDRSLDEVEVWDLLRLLKKVLAETGGDVRRERVITSREVPVRECAQIIEDRLRAGPLPLLAILREQSSHSNLIGCFLAVLLLLKIQMIEVRATADGEDMELTWKSMETGDQPSQQIELEDDFRS